MYPIGTIDNLILKVTEDTLGFYKLLLGCRKITWYTLKSQPGDFLMFYNVLTEKSGCLELISRCLTMGQQSYMFSCNI